MAWWVGKGESKELSHAGGRPSGGGACETWPGEVGVWGGRERRVWEECRGVARVVGEHERHGLARERGVGRVRVRGSVWGNTHTYEHAHTARPPTLPAPPPGPPPPPPHTNTPSHLHVEILALQVDPPHLGQVRLALQQHLLLLLGG